MFKDQNTFQLIVIIIFGIFAVIGVFVFATQSGKGGLAYDVEVWGTENRTLFNNLVTTTFDLDDPLKVTYKQFSEEEFDRELVEALAEGRGPDAVLLSNDRILRHEEKIFVIPYDSFSERDFRNAFISGSEIFLTDEGILGLPFSIDPMVMYWNRSIFGNARVVNPPTYWDEFAQVVPQITETDFSGNVLRAAVALGEYDNVTNAKDIMSTLFIQAGTPITQRSGDSVLNVLNRNFNQDLPPAQTALRFYTEFADPVKSNYSWNRSMPDSIDAFLAGDLGMYFGFASELFEMRQRNPNLDFDVAVFPQIRDADAQSTGAKVSAFVIMKRSANPSATLSAISKLAGRTAFEFMIENTGMPPVSRALLSEKPTDAYMNVFYDSALISKPWLDPEDVETDKIFEQMVEDVTSGRLRISSAVSRASQSLDLLLDN